jgi:hypothetical protein
LGKFWDRRELSGNIQGVFKEISGNIQLNIRGLLKRIFHRFFLKYFCPVFIIFELESDQRYD